jgi:hypothetical protein
MGAMAFCEAAAPPTVSAEKTPNEAIDEAARLMSYLRPGSLRKT